jgi:uncharacterized protein (UPF0276 family)
LNFKFDPVDFISRIPPERIRSIHLAGGRWIGRANAQRLLDDHRHDVPDPVYELLEEVAARVPHALTVILERDGNFPPIEWLIEQLDGARRAVARGRARQKALAA